MSAVTTAAIAPNRAERIIDDAARPFERVIRKAITERLDADAYATVLASEQTTSARLAIRLRPLLAGGAS
jgi:hypothetical protein